MNPDDFPMMSDHVEKFVKHMVSTDDDWALRALARLNETSAFEPSEVDFLRSVATYYAQHGKVSDKQLAWVKKKMHKYSTKLIQLSDKSKLTAMAANWTR